MPRRQVDGLRDCCDRICLEIVSAVSPHRPVFDSVIEELRPGDTRVVWDLHQAFRSVLDALSQAERLRATQIEFEIVTLQIDTTTPAGMLVYTIMSAFAEFERRLLAQRTREGMASARRRGARIGRPTKLDDGQLAEAGCRLLACESPAKVARDMGVARWTLARSLRRALSSLNDI